MAKITVTTRTRKEIDALFAVVFKNVKPAAAAKLLTQEDRLAPYRKAILKQRRRGISWLQIAHTMADPRIGERVSDKLLRRVFGAIDPVKRNGRNSTLVAEAAAERTAQRTQAVADATAEATADAAAELPAEPATEARAEAATEAATDARTESSPPVEH